MIRPPRGFPATLDAATPGTEVTSRSQPRGYLVTVGRCRRGTPPWRLASGAVANGRPDDPYNEPTQYGGFSDPTQAANYGGGAGNTGGQAYSEYESPEYSDYGAPTEQVGPHGEPPAPEPPTPWFRKSAVMIAVGAIAALVLALAIYGIVSLTGDSSTSGDETTTAPRTTSAVETTSTTAPETESATSDAVPPPVSSEAPVQESTTEVTETTEEPTTTETTAETTTEAPTTTETTAETTTEAPPTVTVTETASPSSTRPAITIPIPTLPRGNG